MKKYLSPWLPYKQDYGSDNDIVRLSLDGDWCITINFQGGGWGGVSKNMYWVRPKSSIFRGEGVDCASLNEAKNAADKIAAENGYEFLTEEQWEKYRALL